jgi:hypothetical protein
MAGILAAGAAEERVNGARALDVAGAEDGG